MAGVATGEGVEVRGPVDACCAGVLSADALAFVARLQREFGGRRARSCSAGRSAAGAGRRGAPGLPGRDARRTGGGLARGPGAGRPPGPAGGDHRAGRPQDDDQRPQLGGQGLHGRLRGRPLPHLGEPPGVGQLNLTEAIDRTITLEQEDGRAYRLQERVATLLVRPRGWHLPEKHVLVDGQPVSASLFDFGLLRLPQRPAPPGAGQRALLLPAQAGEPPRGPAVERGLPRPPRSLGIPGEHQGHGADRDDPRRVRDGGDPLRAAGALGRAQRRALGLHLQRHQEVPQRPGVPAPGPGPGDDDRALHARLHGAAGQDLPPPGGPRHGGHGGVHPLPAQSGDQRDGPGPGAGGQGAGVRGRLRRHLGGPPRPRPGGHGGLRRRLWASAPTRCNGSGRRCRSAPSAAGLRGAGGAVTEAGVRGNVSVAIQYLESWLRGVGAPRRSTT